AARDAAPEDVPPRPQLAHRLARVHLLADCLGGSTAAAAGHRRLRPRGGTPGAAVERRPPHRRRARGHAPGERELHDRGAVGGSRFGGHRHLFVRQHPGRVPRECGAGSARRNPSPPPRPDEQAETEEAGEAEQAVNPGVFCEDSRVHARILLILALLAAGCMSTGGPAELKSIADDVWTRRVEDDLAIRLRHGLPIETMPDPSYEKAAADAAFARRILRRLDRIDPARLTAEQRVTYGTLRWQHELEVEGLQHFYLRSQVTPYASAIRTTSEAFRDPKIAADPRIRESYTRYIDALTALVTEQRRRGILIPQPEIPAVRALFGNAPFPDAKPAHDRFLAVLSAEYEAAAPRGVGLSQQPGGAAAYRYLIKASTTLDRSPEEIHALGLREIERIDRELDDIRTQTGFTGTREEFLRFLKTDPRFFESSADGIRSRLERNVQTIEPHLGAFFSKMPRA